MLVSDHSIIFWAWKQATTSDVGNHLGLGELAQVEWKAKRGILCGQLLLLFREYLSTRPRPQVLVVHLGENDLCQRASLSLRLQVHRDFNIIGQWVPGIVILWLEMLRFRLCAAEGGFSWCGDRDHL